MKLPLGVFSCSSLTPFYSVTVLNVNVASNERTKLLAYGGSPSHHGKRIAVIENGVRCIDDGWSRPHTAHYHRQSRTYLGP
jgi:hypothetical protein